jgi:Na+-translocating ferredoxin:NAD+ oxidoreductase RnfG subunit
MDLIKGMRRIAFLLLALPLTVSLVAHESGFPKETLQKVFPDATGFTARKKALTPDQVKRAEQESGSKVMRNDNPLTYYVAVKGQDALGSVVMLDTRGSKGGIDLALGIRRDGTVARLVVVENSDDPALGQAAFLDQIQGKTAQSPLKLGQDIKFSGDARSAQALLSAVRRGLILLAAAQGK